MTVYTQYRDYRRHEVSVKRHLAAAGEQFAKARRLADDDAAWAMMRARGMMGLAAEAAETAAILQGNAFVLLEDRDPMIDEIATEMRVLFGNPDLRKEA
jgi:hypothetical protein